MTKTIQVKRGLAANWASTNPVLAAGEWGLETDTGKTKLGDGVKAWNSLAYKDIDISGKQDVSEKNVANGYAGLDANAKVAAANLPDATTSGKGIAQTATDAEVTAGTDTSKYVTPKQLKDKEDSKRLRQLDLMLPGEFAGAVTDTGLADVGDTSYWLLESGTIQQIAVQCAAADSGATPASVRLVIDGTPVGTAIQALASSLTAITPGGVSIANGARVEIAVTATGTNKDSEYLRMFVVAEV